MKTRVSEFSFNKVADLTPATLFKKKCFPVDFAKFLRTYFCRTTRNYCFQFGITNT